MAARKWGEEEKLGTGTHPPRSPQGPLQPTPPPTAQSALNSPVMNPLLSTARDPEHTQEALGAIWMGHQWHWEVARTLAIPTLPALLQEQASEAGPPQHLPHQAGGTAPGHTGPA